MKKKWKYVSVQLTNSRSFSSLFFFQLLISGLGEINVNDWRTYTMYKGGYTPENQVIQWFWKVDRRDFFEESP